MLKLALALGALAVAAAQAHAEDPFVGTWRLDPARSQFDPNHRPLSATMTFTLEADGAYLLRAEGTKEGGETVKEKPQRLLADGRSRRLPDAPGLSATTTKPDPRTIRTEASREDGTVVGSGTYTVSPDGRSLTATTSGFDAQLREFKQVTVWERQ
jgi:hypothetical protein